MTTLYMAGRLKQFLVDQAAKYVAAAKIQTFHSDNIILVMEHNIMHFATLARVGSVC